MNRMLVGAIGAVVLSALMFALYMSGLSRAEEEGYEKGLQEERLRWQQRESLELAELNQKYQELQNRYRALEKKSAEDVAAAAADHRKEIERVEQERDRALADAADGKRFRLRWAASCAPAPKGDRGGGPSEAGADPGGAGGTATCELPGKTRDDLIRLAGAANEVVKERNALLEIAQKDREVCR